MSRFGWAYVNDIITGSGGSGSVPGGSDKAIQFASGSTFSGSTNFTFDYGTNTVRLTGTLYADNLIVSSSQILKSGSTIFGDDAADTHQFTGSVFTSNNLTVIGQVSASVAINTAGTIQAGSNITSTGGIVSSSGGFSTAATITAAGIISSSAEIKSNSSITASNNIISTAGFVSASNGLYSGNGLTVTGSTFLNSGLTVTGSSFVQALSSSGQIQATSLRGNGLNITGVQATNVDGAGDNWAVQFKSGNTGTLTGSSNLLFSGSTLTLTGSLLMSGTSYISEVDYIDFDVAASTPSHKNGRVFWNNTEGCLNVYNAEADVTLQVGQKNLTRIRNNTGTTVTNGTVVRIIGSQGDAPTIERAQSIAKSGSINVETQILGLATHDIEDSSFGYVTTQGLVRGLNTNAFADGETLFVGTGSAGVLQNTAPVAPYEIIPVGVCVKAGPGASGIIYVAVQQPIDFPDLSSVFVSGNYAYGDIWTYVSSSNTGYWTHTNTLSGSYIITGSLTLTGTLSGTTARFTTITGSVFTGSTGLYTTLTASNINFNTITGSGLNSLTNNNLVKYNPNTKIFGPASLISESSSAGIVTISGSVGLIVTGSVRATGLIINGTTTLGAGFAAGYSTSTTTFTVQTSSYFVGINTTSGSVTANFLSASSYSAGQMFIFKDIGGFAGTVGKEIIITPSGSQKIDNASGATIASNSGSLTMITDGVSEFYIIGTV